MGEHKKIEKPGLFNRLRKVELDIHMTILSREKADKSRAVVLDNRLQELAIRKDGILNKLKLIYKDALKSSGLSPKDFMFSRLDAAKKEDEKFRRLLKKNGMKEQCFDEFLKGVSPFGIYNIRKLFIDAVRKNTDILKLNVQLNVHGVKVIIFDDTNFNSRGIRALCNKAVKWGAKVEAYLMGALITAKGVDRNRAMINMYKAESHLHEYVANLRDCGLQVVALEYGDIPWRMPSDMPTVK